MSRRRSHLRIAATTLAVGLLALCLFAALSQAHQKAYTTLITASAQNKNFAEGTVSSPNPVCIPGRTVIVLSGSVVELGTAPTDTAGKWKVAATLTPGTYGAKVTQRNLRKTRKHKHRCRPASTTFVAG